MKAVCFVFILLSAIASAAADLQTSFERGNKAYEQKDYRAAISAYREALKSGQASAAIYFNLANAHFRAGEFGRAIANYRKAQRLAPRDASISENLQFAREKVDPQNADAAALGDWERKVTLTEALVVAGLFFWTFFGLLTVQQVRRDLAPRLRMAVIITGLAAAATGIFAAIIHAEHKRTIAVVVVPETAVRYGPLEESQTAFSLRDGAELVVTDRQRDWAQVRDAAGRLGWAPVSALELLN